MRILVFLFIHQRDEPEHLKERVSRLSADLPSSLSDCLRSPLLLLTLTGFTPPPPKFHRGWRRSLHSNTPMARANGVWGETTICGFHGDRSYCIIPQHRVPGEREPPSLCTCGASPPKHTHLFMTSPTQIRVTKDASAFFVAFNFVRMTKLCLHFIYLF